MNTSTLLVGGKILSANDLDAMNKAELKSRKVPLKDNRASNATYLGEFIAGIIQPAPEDQYQPMPAKLFVEQEPEQEPGTEETEKDLYWVAGKSFEIEPK